MSSIGIRHVHLLVADHDRSIAFYREALGMEEQFRDRVRTRTMLDFGEGDRPT